MTLYRQPHQSQYQPGASAITRSAGCTWTTGANGIGAISGGRKRPTPDEIKALLRRDEETSPATPGWSLTDLVRAMARYGVTLTDRSGDGWDAVIGALEAGRYVVLQGDSDQFGNATCSGSFDGDHAIGVLPLSKTVSGARYWWINDPICPEGRWERSAVLKRYAVKLSSSIRFAVFAQPVPSLPWHVEVPAGQTFLLYSVDDGVITGQPKRIISAGWLDRCSPPRYVAWPGHRARRLVRVTDCTHNGRHRGYWLNARRATEETQ
jgi:hypothetical protein